MSQMERGDVVVHISCIEELFAIDATAVLHGEGRLVPGVDELVAELLAAKRPGLSGRVVVVLPASEIDANTQAEVEAALRRYCRHRIGRVEREDRVIWRQGMRSLRSGLVLFVVGLVLSSGFLEPDVPAFWQAVLGNGFFLILAWVGLWYPLDLLFFERQPLRREMKILEMIGKMSLEIRPAPFRGLHDPDR